MMKRRIALLLAAGLFGLAMTRAGMAQEPEIKPEHQIAPTLMGGSSTGLFNTLGTRTLRRGEFTFGVFWNNYDRDPGDLDINQIPVNFGYGITDRWEVFVNIDFFQQVTAGRPLTISGPQFNGIRSAFGGDPLVAFGQPVGGRNDAPAAFFPFSGSPGGGILPPPGKFLGPEFVTDRPSFFNELPFFGPAFFDPATGEFSVLRSANGTGNLTLGTKFNLLDPDRWFSLAVAGLVRIPTVRHFQGLANGRGSGEIDFGPMLVVGQSFHGQRLRFSENIGYIRSGDPGKDGVKFLDRRDQLLLNAGVEVAAHQKLVLVGELDGTVYVGSGTPNLNAVNPLDLVVGLRYYALDGLFNLGAGYRRFLTASNSRTITGFLPDKQPGLRTFPIGTGDVNGFVFSLGLGRRIKPIPPPPPCGPPTVVLEADKMIVRDGEIVNLTARATDPDNDPLVYTWASTSGEVVGEEGKARLDTSGVNPTEGAAPVEVTVTVTVDDQRCGTDSSSVTITVNAPPPPPNQPPVIDSIECSQVVGTPQIPGQITDGEIVRVRAVASDPEGHALTYEWSATAGQLRGSGPDVTLDTTGVTAGPGAPPVEITITLTVRDDQGGSDRSTCRLTVTAVKKPEPTQIMPNLEFRRGSARVNNVHKAILDNVALRLQQEPEAILVIDGHADRGESVRLAQRRAENVKRYLVREKGIDSDRIVVRSFGAGRPHPSGERAKNRRVELWFVPAGAEPPQ